MDEEEEKAAEPAALPKPMVEVAPLDVRSVAVVAPPESPSRGVFGKTPLLAKSSDVDAVGKLIRAEEREVGSVRFVNGLLDAVLHWLRDTALGLCLRAVGTCTKRTSAHVVAPGFS